MKKIVAKKFRRCRLLCLCLVCILSGCQSAETGAGREEGGENGTENQKTAETTEAAEAAESADDLTDKVSRDLFAMDTYMVLTAYGEHAEDALEAAEEEILRLEELLSTGKETSEVSQLNRNGGGTLSEDTAALVERSLELYASTEGAFDIAVYPLMQAWGFSDGDFQVPSDEEIQELLLLTDASMIVYDGEAATVSFENEEMEIDLGGIAKGYTSDRIMDIFREYGVTSGMVNLGGNVQTLGTKPDGSAWKVAVQSPEEDGTYLGVLSVADWAVITSGGYERYFEQDGIRYHHIIDPETGYPADSGLTSVTIVSSDGTLADGLSTSLFIMGKDRAIAYWRENSELFDAILLEEDGSLYVTEGLADIFTSDLDYEIVEKEGA